MQVVPLRVDGLEHQRVPKMRRQEAREVFLRREFIFVLGMLPGTVRTLLNRIAGEHRASCHLGPQPTKHRIYLGRREVLDGRIPDHVVEWPARYTSANVHDIVADIGRAIVSRSVSDCPSVEVDTKDL